MEQPLRPTAGTTEPGTMQTTRALAPGSVTRRVLDNGLVVLVYPSTAIPTVTARYSAKAGAVYDAPDKPGVAGLTAGSLRRGTARHSFSELNQITEERGLSIGADSGHHLLEVGGRGLSEDADFLLDTMAEVIRTPRFPTEEVERLRHLLITGLREQEDDTGAMASKVFRTAAYPADHPYRRPVSGDLESVPQITREDMEAHYRRYVRPDNATLVIVGDITPEAALALVERTFGDWRAEGAPPPFAIPDAPQPAETQEVFHFIAGKTQNDLILGFPSIRRNNPDYYALEMMNLILGRLGLYGRLGKSVREDQGLAYYAVSGFEAGFGPGPWSVRAGVNPTNVRRAVSSILAEMERIQREPISAQELLSGQRYLTGTLPLRLETNGGIARQILEIELFDLGWDYIQRFPGIIGSLTVEEVQRAAQTYLHPDRYVLAIAGPELPPQPA
jgi:zinc protease